MPFILFEQKLLTSRGKKPPFAIFVKSFRSSYEKALFLFPSNIATDDERKKHNRKKTQDKAYETKKSND